MDLIKLLIGLEKDTCFLCFKCDKNNLNIHTAFEIHHEHNNVLRSVADMLKTLFPFEDIIFKQLCNGCLEVLFKMYILVTKRKIRSLLLESLTKQFDRKISEISVGPEHNDKVVIKLQVATLLEGENNEPTYNKDTHNSIDNLFNEATFVCDLCDDCFDTKEALKQHQRGHKEGLKICPQCPETFALPDQYQAYLKIHKKKKRKSTYHYCNDCDYKTLSKSTLQAHINKYHLQTRPHVCQVCFKGFYNKSNLNEHIRTHNSQRNEICEICGCSFLHKKNLVEHLRLHSGARPYECDICRKKFVTSGRRSDHIKRNHMERSECCLICNKKYSLKKELSRHMNTAHLKSI